MSTSRRDPIALIEAAYDFDHDEEAWLARVREAASGFMPPRNVRAVISMIYRAPNATSFHVERASAHGMDAVSAVLGLTTDVALDPAYLARTLLVKTCEYVSAVSGWEQQANWGAVRAAYGAVDGFVVNGLDATGLGVATIVLVSARTSAPDAWRETISRVTAHTVAALRIRRRLGSADRMRDAEAIIDADGKIAHAVGDARSVKSREGLRRAARALDLARGPMRRQDADRAVARWKVLVDSRWSLLDHFEQDGKRYLLACGNDASAEPDSLLTPRERQVTLLATRGHSNKLIAYELGIAASTVGVLMGRAAARLGVHTRKALIERFGRR
jgi:DNA-binding CsgD family transcriptional regulator